MSNAIRHLLTITVLLAALAIVAAAQSEAATQDEAVARNEQQPELDTPYGIWTHKDTILLFAPARQCEDDGGGYQPMQTIISKDAGKSWTKSGPRFVGSTLMYLLDTGDDLWFAGEEYAEGPTHSPFLLRFDPESAEWPQLDIEDESLNYGADLRALAQDTRNPNHFLAWITHLSIDDPEAAPVFLHRSLDQGKSWKQLQQVKRVPRSWKGFRFFKEPPMESGGWRIDTFTHPRTLEHLEQDGQWHTVVTLPLAIQNTCSE